MINPFIKLDYYNSEFWIKITNNMIENVQPYYWISNLGKVYSEITNRMLNISLDHNGYCVVHMRLYDNKSRMIKVHRLVALGFIICNGNPNDFQVNHKDGNKLNNTIFNLEWNTAYENIHHAIDNGLRKAYGENIHTSVLNNNLVIEISKLLIQNTSYREIIKILNLPDNGDSIRRIERIKCKETWTIITKDYDFSNYDPYESIRIFNDIEIHQICNYLQTYGKNSNISDIMMYINKEYNSLLPKDKTKYSGAIGKIRRRERFKYISNNYNF